MKHGDIPQSVMNRFHRLIANPLLSKGQKMTIAADFGWAANEAELNAFCNNWEQFVIDKAKYRTGITNE